MSKNSPNFCIGGYFEFWAQNWQKGVKICNLDEPFFLGWAVSDMADRVIFDIGWVVDKACVYTMKGQW